MQVLSLPLYMGATLVLSVALGLYLTPIVRRGALRFGVLDHGNGHLKRQREPVPYLGGIAVYLAFLLSLSFVFDLRGELLGLLLGGTIVVMIGLFDDMHVLPPRLKLLGQLLAAWVLIKSGIAIELVALPQWLATPLTVLWLVGMTNAFNILDVSDALAGSVAAIAGLGLFLLAYLQGDALIAATTLALIGALAGFLRFNRPPARIYLGDAGSLFLGFMLGALSMIGKYTTRHEVGALAPLAILCVPIFEVALVSAARLARGHSPFAGSPDHFACRLKARGWSAQRVAAAGASFSVLGAGAGITLVHTGAVVALAILGGLSLALLGVFVWLWQSGTRSAQELERAKPLRAAQPRSEQGIATLRAEGRSE